MTTIDPTRPVAAEAHPAHAAARAADPIAIEPELARAEGRR
jgi:hypothetical protein